MRASATTATAAAAAVIARAAAWLSGPQHETESIGSGNGGGEGRKLACRHGAGSLPRLGGTVALPPPRLHRLRAGLERRGHHLAALRGTGNTTTDSKESRRRGELAADNGAPNSTAWKKGGHQEHRGAGAVGIFLLSGYIDLETTFSHTGRRCCILKDKQIIKNALKGVTGDSPVVRCAATGTDCTAAGRLARDPDLARRDRGPLDENPVASAPQRRLFLFGVPGLFLVYFVRGVRPFCRCLKKAARRRPPPPRLHTI